MKKGFTLIELAIVLIIIGLILGMVFKGKQLIESAKVKHLAAQYNKILAAVNTFYERYGFYPGDGCTTATPSSVSACSGPRDGIIQENNIENKAFWHLLINVTHILSANDRRNPFGHEWIVIYTTDTFSNRWANWLDTPIYNGVDVRIVCALDQMIDDGEATTGDVVTPHHDPYDPDTDCWSLSGQKEIRLYLLP